jgi:transcriptional regulator with XRE-family HTH domain
MSIREISRRTGLARNTVKKYLRSDETETTYTKRISPSKLDPYAEKLATWLGIEATKSRKQRRNLKQIYTGGDSELEFVARVLRAYSGETFIHPIARELIKRLPSGSPLVTEVEIALQSTGVVSGEYGMAEAYERKRLEVLDWLQDPNDRIRTFAVKYISELESMRDSERARAEESIALRKFNYGEM